MKRKVLLIIGAGPDQIPAYELARKMGVLTVGLDMNPNAPAYAIANYKITASTRDIPAVIAAVRAFTHRIDGVMTLGAEVSPTVAAVAAMLGLPGVSPYVAHITTNKIARSMVLRAHEVSIPKFWIGKAYDEFDDLDVIYPVVVKPSDSSASRGVRMINTRDELTTYFDVAKGYATDGQVMLEQYITGDQVSIEGIVVDGRLHITGFADRNYTRNTDYYPYFVEDGSQSPSALSPDVISNVCREFTRAVAALSITTGPTKGDVIITPDGRVYIIEVTSRLSGGGFCSRIVPLTTGVNIVKHTIELALGLPVDVEALVPRYQRAAAHRFYFHQAGTIERITGMTTVHTLPYIADVVVQRPFAVGDVLASASYANRLLYVIAVADDRATAVAAAARAIAHISIDTVA